MFAARGGGGGGGAVTSLQQSKLTSLFPPERAGGRCADAAGAVTPGGAGTLQAGKWAKAAPATASTAATTAAATTAAATTAAASGLCTGAETGRGFRAAAGGGAGAAGGGGGGHSGAPGASTGCTGGAGSAAAGADSAAGCDAASSLFAKPTAHAAAPLDPPSGFQLLENSRYIRTPGNHLVDLSEFWMGVDSDMQSCAPCAQLSDFASYAHEAYQAWRALEDSLGDDVRFCFEGAGAAGGEFDKYRVYSVTWVFRTASSLGFAPGVIHYAVYNLNRAFRLLRDGGHKVSLPLFFGILSACLRVAVKHDESFERQYRVKYEARTAFSVSSELEVCLGTEKLNHIESRLIGFLSAPMLPPSSLDFLDRYLRVGRWPEQIVAQARALAHYCLDLFLFAGHQGLTRLGPQRAKPSLLAAAALALAVKIVGAMHGSRFEPWPRRLEVYTGYRVSDLTPGIALLSSLLRAKPQGSNVLESLHTYWGVQAWQ